MNEIIRKRKSIRKYEPEKLDAVTLEKVQEKIKNLKPLFPDIRYSVEIGEKTRGIFNIKAPHYLLFRSEEKEGSYENIGFIGQQMDLFFSASGLGACWLGVSKPTDNEASPPEAEEKSCCKSLPFVICMSFGKAAEPLHRSLAEFKRKNLSVISEGSDERLEAARLAPSATNIQNWYFIAENGEIHCYVKKANLLLGLFYNKLNRIDLGIAICHIAEESGNFNFVRKEKPPVRGGYIYAGTVNGD